MVSSEAPCTFFLHVGHAMYHIVLSVLRWVTVAFTEKKSAFSPLRPIASFSMSAKTICRAGAPPPPPEPAIEIASFGCACPPDCHQPRSACVSWTSRLISQSNIESDLPFQSETRAPFAISTAPGAIAGCAPFSPHTVASIVLPESSASTSTRFLTFFPVLFVYSWRSCADSITPITSTRASFATFARPTILVNA